MSWARPVWTRDPRAEAPGRGPRSSRWGLALLGLAVLLLAFLAGLMASGPRSLSKGGPEPLAEINRLLAQVAEVQLAERRYLVSGREDDARVHEAAAREAEHLLGRLAGLGVPATPGEPASALESLVLEVVRSSRESVRIRRHEGLEAALRRTAAGDPRLSPDRIRRILRELAAAGRLGLLAREEALESELRVRTAFALASGILAVIAAALAFVAFSRRPVVTEFVDLAGAPLGIASQETAGRAGEVFQSLLQTLEDGVVVVDEHGRVVASNKPAEEALGGGAPGARAAARDRRPGLYLPPDVGPGTVGSPLQRALKGEVVRGATLLIGGPAGGASRSVSVNARPVQGGPAGALGGAVVVLRDVTELRGAEAARREAEQRFSHVLEGASLGIARLSGDGRVETANPALCRLLGYEPDELVGREATSLSRRDESGKGAALLQELLAGARDRYEIESRCRTKDDLTRWLRWNVSALRDPAGAVVGAMATIDDVTPLRRLESTARESRDLLRKTLDLVPVGVWIVDRQGRVRLSNPAGSRIWFNKGDVLRFQEGEYKGWWADTGNRIGSGEWGALRVIETGEPMIDKIIEVQRFDGTRRTLLTSAIPFTRPSGSLAGVVVVNHDITKEGWTGGERLRLERELHEAILQVDALRSLVPICPLCEKTRDDPAYWRRLRDYVGEHVGDLRDEACRACQYRAYELSPDVPVEGAAEPSPEDGAPRKPSGARSR